MKKFNEFINEGKEEDFYQSTLNDDYWKEISKKFPNYNDPNDKDCNKAVEYIFKNMKDKYKNENIPTTIKKKIHGGIT